MTKTKATKATKAATTTKAVPFLVATEHAVQQVNAILYALDQPMNTSKASQTKIKSDLYALLKEICELTQLQLMKNRAGEPNGVRADIVGWTTADTDFDNEKVKYKQSHLVNEYLQQILDEQAKADAAAGAPVSIQNVLKAQEDALNRQKDTITLEAMPDQETNIESKLEISKQTGDTDILRKDPKTGLWVKVGSTLKGYWKDVKNFGKNIWKWIAQQWSNFVSWIKGIFKSPEDSEVVFQQAA